MHAGLFLSFTCVVRSQVLAFPGADGFGKYTWGGRSGKVIEVTNLNDAGEGSLRAAVAEKGTRTIVFRISGTITLKSELKIEEDSVTIAGQTAPGDGICVRDFPTVIAANNVVVRYLRFRMGDEARQVGDALSAIGCRDVIVDHCSMSWGNDEVASFYDNRNFTLQWSIISEALHGSVHPKGNHGYGGIWGGLNASFHHNLFAHNASRNPRFNGGRTSGKPEEELVDFRNNVIYNWGFKCIYGGEAGRQNVVANYFKPAAASLMRSSFFEPFDSTGRWHVAENVIEGSTSVTKDNWKGIARGLYMLQVKNGSSFDFIIDKTEKAEEAYASVLEAVGAVRPKQDAVDTRIIVEVKEGRTSAAGRAYSKEYKKKRDVRTGIIDSQAEVGGWSTLNSAPPPPDEDHDGMPDEWEIAQKLNPTAPHDGRLIGPDGYSNLEKYLNSLAERKE